MAKQRFTFQDAKNKIKQLEEALADAQLKQNNNVYDRGEQRWIKFYQWGFFLLLIFNLLYFLYGKNHW